MWVPAKSTIWEWAFIGEVAKQWVASHSLAWMKLGSGGQWPEHLILQRSIEKASPPDLVSSPTNLSLGTLYWVCWPSCSSLGVLSMLWTQGLCTCSHALVGSLGLVCALSKSWTPQGMSECWFWPHLIGYSPREGARGRAHGWWALLQRCKPFPIGTDWARAVAGTEGAACRSCRQCWAVGFGPIPTDHLERPQPCMNVRTEPLVYSMKLINFSGL